MWHAKIWILWVTSLEAQIHDWCNDWWFASLGLICTSERWREMMLLYRDSDSRQKVFSFCSVRRQSEGVLILVISFSDAKDSVLVYWIFKIQRSWFPPEGFSLCSVRRCSHSVHIFQQHGGVCVGLLDLWHSEDSHQKVCSRSVLSEGVLILFISFSHVTDRLCKPLLVCQLRAPHFS